MQANYFTKVQQLLNTVFIQESEKLEMCSEALAECFSKGGILHVFGCGHSHMIAEEVFYRAGGAVPVHPIFVEKLMLHKGALQSSELEKSSTFASTFLPSLSFRSNDILLVVSTSGRNPVPIDVALYGKKHGIKVITISSHLYHDLTSRHSTGEFLANIGDIAINNHIPQGDALISFPQLLTSVGPGSTITNAAIVNSIIVRTVELLDQKGIFVPIFKSGNVDGSQDHNKKLVEEYRGRIGFL